jgi:succinyl-diaminopimelate desuccinylase
MTTTDAPADPRAALAGDIEAEAERILALFRDFMRIDTSNPPGDTVRAADFVEGLLVAEGHRPERIAPQADKPNIVVHCSGRGPGHHLILNGHMDVFPAGDESRWTKPPFGAELADGYVYGRGAIDMKCGSTASIATFLLLSRHREAWDGQLTLTMVSDEETGGAWGTGYLLEHHRAAVLGDCVLNGEPSSRYTVRFGEKAVVRKDFHIRTAGGHGAYTHLSPSATKIAAEAMLALYALEDLEPEVPRDLAETMARNDVRAALEDGLGAGAADVVGRLTVNIGVVRGGVKVNMLPGECMFQVDLRLPVGITRDRVEAEIARILERFPEVSVSEGEHSSERAYVSPTRHPMLDAITQNAERIAGVRPAPVVTLGGTDCRFWRARGVPAYVYGPTPDRMGAPDERVAVEELMNVVRVHVLSAYDYLAGGVR